MQWQVNILIIHYYPAFNVSSPAVLLTMRSFPTVRMSLLHAPRASRSTEFPWQQTGDRGLPPIWKTGFRQLWAILHCKSIDRLSTKHPQIISSISNFQYGSAFGDKSILLKSEPAASGNEILPSYAWENLLQIECNDSKVASPIVWTVVHHAIEGTIASSRICHGQGVILRSNAHPKHWMLTNKVDLFQHCIIIMRGKYK